MPQVESITIQGFKSLKSIKRLELKAINLIIGPNGSGKSNFIGVFSFLHAVRQSRLQDYVSKAGGSNRILHFGSSITSKLLIHINFTDDINQYQIELEPTELDELIPVSETAYFWNKNFPHPLGNGIYREGKEAGISRKSQSTVGSYVQDHLDKWRVYHFHDTSPTSPMKKTMDIDDNRFLRYDGSNLAGFLYYLESKHTDAYAQIREVVKRVAPFSSDFNLAPQKLNPEKIRLEWKHANSDAYFDASSLSDGTLRFIALATLLLQPLSYCPSVILVDEPELGLHPYAIKLLASLIQQASAKTQIIISTQSPQLLDHFEPEDVLVAERIEGGTQFTRLESKDLDSWLEEYSLGQLWEKNEIGGRPKPE